MYKGVPWAVLLRQTPICLVLFIWGGVWWGCLGRLGLSLGAPPIHIKPTQWAYGARKVLTWPPGWGAGPSRTYGWGHILARKSLFFIPGLFWPGEVCLCPSGRAFKCQHKTPLCPRLFWVCSCSCPAPRAHYASIFSGHCSSDRFRWSGNRLSGTKKQTISIFLQTFDALDQ